MDIDFKKQQEEFGTYIRGGKTRIGILGKNPHHDWWILISIFVILLASVFALAYFQMKTFEKVNNTSVEQNNRNEVFSEEEIEGLILEFEQKRSL